MITRRNLLAAVAAGSLSEFSLVAAPMAKPSSENIGACKTGKDACATGNNTNRGDSCGNSGGLGQDKCNAGHADGCRARVNDAACGSDGCHAKGGSDVE